MPKPRLLIVGGGFAGISLALNSSSFADVTLVSRTEYFELTWATPRAMVDASTAERAIWSLGQMPLGATSKRGVVVSMTDKEATLDSGEVVRFDYAALCHGSSYADTFAKSAASVTRDDRLKELAAKGEAIRNAKNIVVVGGGPAGVEAAAEIVEAYAGKKITLVTPGARLLESSPAKIGAHAKAWLAQHGVSVVLGERASVAEGVDRSAPGTVTLSSGKTVQADVVLWCVGGSVNSDYLKAHLGNAVDPNGRVKVNDKLQVEGYPHMFALGDCNNFPEPFKQGFLATLQGQLVAKSIQALIASKSAKLGVYKPMNGMFVTLGRGAGGCHVGGCTSTAGCVMKGAKSRDLFIDKYRQDFKVVG